MKQQWWQELYSQSWLLEDYYTHTHRSKCRQTIIQVKHLEQNQQKLNATINNRLQLTKYDLLYVQKFNKQLKLYILYIDLWQVKKNKKFN